MDRNWTIYKMVYGLENAVSTRNIPGEMALATVAFIVVTLSLAASAPTNDMSTMQRSTWDDKVASMMPNGATNMTNDGTPTEKDDADTTTAQTDLEEEKANKSDEEEGDVTDVDVYSVLPTAPMEQATVCFGNETVDMGNELTPTQVHGRPNISWPADKDAFYSLFLTDLDPTGMSFSGQVQHWLVVNIPDTNIDQGNVIFDFIGSAPNEGSGLHRYLFTIFKQKQKLEKRDFEDIKDVEFDIRRIFSVKDLIQKLKLEDVVAGNYYRAQYDQNVPTYYQERNQKYNQYKLVQF